MYDAIVLAGGRARRLAGADKPAQIVGGRTLLERAVEAVAGAGRVVVVGPRRPLEQDVVWCQEDPPGGGPVAAIAAGLPHTTREVVVVLAADLPHVAPAVPELVRALDGSGVDAALLADPDGRANHLAAAWRRAALVTSLAALGDPDGTAVRALLGSASVILVPDVAGWGRDCDTWDDLAAARAAEGEQLMADDDLDHWITDLCAALQLDPAALDRDLLLDLARDAAHGVARPAAPLTTFLVGLAAGRNGGTRAAVEEAAQVATELATNRP